MTLVDRYMLYKSGQVIQRLVIKVATPSTLPNEVG